MNLDYVKPFSNTSDLKNMTPKLHPDLAEKREINDDAKRMEDMIGKDNIDEIQMDEDPLSKLISNAREALGKEASKSDRKDE